MARPGLPQLLQWLGCLLHAMKKWMGAFLGAGNRSDFSVI